MEEQEHNKGYLNEDNGLPDKEVFETFTALGYRGFKEIKSQSKDPVVEIVVKNDKGRTLTSTGETREEAIESIIEKIDHYLDEK
ncbi:MAG TPA: hypothetical protein VKA34_03080 [Balneolales bacterium]|nr:hypothetical protein [Balneolales bacterium]